MTPNPILKVLSTIREKNVRALLMGGQACVLYGAAEFSRDTDLALQLTADNLELLRSALDDLQAEVVAVPPFERAYLERGHAIHFRCQHPDAMRMRIDVMSVMRGVDPFEQLWERRTTIQPGPGQPPLELLSLPDLVKAKKTQRDKDWPMIRRLVEANYFANRDDPNPEQLQFWLQEMRTPEILIDLCERNPRLAASLAKARPLLQHAKSGDKQDLENALREEEHAERDLDRAYWNPLRAELERLRLSR